MADAQTSRITEDDKLLLAEYLLDRVLTGLSGRDGEDLVDTTPTRTIFAGVLSPPRSAEVEAARRGLAIGDAPAGTSMGLDFRVRPTGERGTVRLRIAPRWSHYYPVFPTWEQAVRANEGTIQAAGAEVGMIGEDDGGELALLDGGVGRDTDGTGAEVGEETDEQAGGPAQAQPGQAVLPRVWRRRDVTVDEIQVDLLPDQTVVAPVGAREIAMAIDEASVAMAADPNGWRHLGDPKQRQRVLGDAGVLASERAYASALTRVQGERAPLPPWSASVQVESSPDPTAPDVLRVRVLLANTTPELRLYGPDRETDEVDPLLQERPLFDAGLAVDVEGGEVVPFDFLLAPKDYRTNPQMVAKGINCVARRSEATRGRLETETLPVFRQPLYRTRDDLEVRFGSLDVADPVPELERIAGAMDEYLQLWDRFLAMEAPRRFGEAEIEACKSDREQFRREIERYRLGIEALRRDPRLLEAFRLMNRTFGRLAARSGGRVRAWRLFQIGFIVSQLPALAVRELGADESGEYAGALRDAFGDVGVLWFPTGGGKTEAYLGLIATALLYDRLRGKQRGVCAWMRFPLRMLSLQQLERLARVIAALNELRAEEPRVQAGDPFAIGYYVGSANTPNRLDRRAMERFKQREDLREEVRLLRKCPFCGSLVEIKPDERTWRLAHVCSNKDCFSNTSASMEPYRGSLPVCVVDYEIYRYLPSVLVGTVDKLAIAGRNRYFAHLTRGVSQQCPVHGYTSYDECMEQGDRWGGCKAKKSDLLKVSAFKDPGLSLLIQDELHLLRDELGVFNGHYEGLLQYLGAKAHLPAKVLAATATIEAYDVQAFHIYLSRARRYPQPAWEQGESFYATSRPTRQRRLYAGVLGHTRAIEEPALRVLALYQREIRRLKAEPCRAAEIMQRTDASTEAIRDTLRLYDLSLAYVNRKATGGSIADKVGAQIDRLLAPEDLGTVQARLLTGDQTLDEVGATLERIEREREETGEPRLDLVIATNLISHGVDLERINMMSVCGMPSHYAEYVQSTSRAARTHPGLVFVCFRARDPRETSQYEFFPAMHEHMERLIEAVAVNRFASFAPEKTVPGLLAGVLLHDLSPDLFAARQIAKALDHVPTLLTALGKRPRDKAGTVVKCIEESDLLDALRRIIGVDEVRPPASPAQVRNVSDKIAQVFEDRMGAIKRTDETWLSDVLEPVTSFRDVDEGIEFGSLDSAALVERIRGR